MIDFGISSSEDKPSSSRTSIWWESPEYYEPRRYLWTDSAEKFRKNSDLDSALLSYDEFNNHFVKKLNARAVSQAHFFVYDYQFVFQKFQK